MLVVNSDLLVVDGGLLVVNGGLFCSFICRSFIINILFSPLIYVPLKQIRKNNLHLCLSYFGKFLLMIFPGFIFICLPASVWSNPVSNMLWFFLKKKSGFGKLTPGVC